MLEKALIYALDKAQSPRQVRAVTRLLEKATGFSTTDVTDWYQRNGYYRLAGGYYGTSYSGKNVTIDSSLESAAVYAAVKIIAEDMGTLPFVTYRAEGGKIDRAPDHPLYRILHDLANPEMSSGELVESLTAHALLGLDGFAYIERNRAGQPIYLWPWQASDITEVTHDSKGQLVYTHREGGRDKTYKRSDVFHLRGFMYEGYRGDNIIRRARHVLGLTLSTDEFAGRYFSNDTSVGVVITRPADATPLGDVGIQKVKDAWKAWHQGVSKSHEPAILQEGMTASRIGHNANESQLIPQRTFQILEVCRLFRIQPHKLAELSRANFSNVDALAIEHVQYTLMPWVRRWKQAVHRCLLSPEEQIRGEIYAEHSVEALLRGDFRTQTEGFRTLLEKGVYSINEVRKWFNLNPVEGGDARFIQLNMQSIVDAATGRNLPHNGAIPVGGSDAEE